MKIRTLFSVLLMTALTCHLTSCKDDDKIVGNTDPDEKEMAGYDMTSEQVDEYAAMNFISHVCQVEYDTLTYALKSWEPDYGRILFENTPTVRYTRALTEEDARNEFLSMICSVATIDSTAADGTMTVSMGSHGSVRYIPDHQNGHLAYIDVNLKELPDITRITFFRSDAWPENAGTCGGISPGTVLIGRRGGKDVYFLCVKGCGETGTGYFIGFDTWTVTPVSPAGHSHKKRTCYDEWWGNADGGKHLIECLRGYMYYYDGSKNPDAESTIRQISKLQGGHSNNGRLGGENALHDFLYGEGWFSGKTPFFKTGDDHCWVDTHGSKDDDKWHFVRTPCTRITSDHKGVESVMVCYDCDEVDPHNYDRNNSHTRDENKKKWGNSIVLDQFLDEWIWKVKEWYSFQSPWVITFHDTDASTFDEFCQKYHLEEANFDD